MVGNFENENQPSDLTKFGNFLDQLRDCQLPKKASMEIVLDFCKNVEILDLTDTICIYHQCLVNPNLTLETDPDLNSSYLTSNIHVLVSKMESTLNLNSNTLEPDRPQCDRHVFRVIAQQYSSAISISLPQIFIRPTLKEYYVLFYISFFFKLRKSEIV